MQTPFANGYAVPMSARDHDPEAMGREQRAAARDDIPRPPWAPASPTTATRRPPITRDAIVETALGVLDREGLDALSMRRVAAEMGTGAAALYRHVANKDELLDLLLDRVIGEIEPPPAPDPERWTEQLKEVGRSVRAGMLRHRDVVRISMGRFPAGPNGLRFAEGTLAILRAGGLPDRLAATASHLSTVIVNAFALEDVAPLGGADATPEEVGAMVEGYISSLPADRFPNLVALASELTADDLDTRFELLLDIYVDGLAARAS
jgi:AcrR family transcriptional regulator